MLDPILLNSAAHWAHSRNSLSLGAVGRDWNLVSCTRCEVTKGSSLSVGGFCSCCSGQQRDRWGSRHWTQAVIWLHFWEGCGAEPAGFLPGVAVNYGVKAARMSPLPFPLHQGRDSHSPRRSSTLQGVKIQSTENNGEERRLFFSELAIFSEFLWDSCLL